MKLFDGTLKQGLLLIVIIVSAIGLVSINEPIIGITSIVMIILVIGSGMIKVRFK